MEAISATGGESSGPSGDSSITQPPSLPVVQAPRIVPDRRTASTSTPARGFVVWASRAHTGIERPKGSSGRVAAFFATSCRSVTSSREASASPSAATTTWYTPAPASGTSPRTSMLLVVSTSMSPRTARVCFTSTSEVRSSARSSSPASQNTRLRRGTWRTVSSTSSTFKCRTVRLFQADLGRYRPLVEKATRDERTGTETAERTAPAIAPPSRVTRPSMRTFWAPRAKSPRMRNPCRAGTTVKSTGGSRVMAAAAASWPGMHRDDTSNQS